MSDMLSEHNEWPSYLIEETERTGGIANEQYGFRKKVIRGPNIKGTQNCKQAKRETPQAACNPGHT